MNKTESKQVRRGRRRLSIKRRVRGTAARPRLSVHRSLNHIYAQVIDDLQGVTLCAASTREGGLGLSATGNVDAAGAVGKAIAERAKEKGIGTVVFDRGWAKYHGRVKAVADAARDAGLEF